MKWKILALVFIFLHFFILKINLYAQDTQSQARLDVFLCIDISESFWTNKREGELEDIIHNVLSQLRNGDRLTELRNGDRLTVFLFAGRAEETLAFSEMISQTDQIAPQIIEAIHNQQQSWNDERMNGHVHSDKVIECTKFDVLFTKLQSSLSGREEPDRQNPLTVIISDGEQSESRGDCNCRLPSLPCINYVDGKLNQILMIVPFHSGTCSLTPHDIRESWERALHSSFLSWADSLHPLERIETKVDIRCVRVNGEDVRIFLYIPSPHDFNFRISDAWLCSDGISRQIELNGVTHPACNNNGYCYIDGRVRNLSIFLENVRISYNWLLLGSDNIGFYENNKKTPSMPRCVFYTDTLVLRNDLPFLFRYPWQRELPSIKYNVEKKIKTDLEVNWECLENSEVDLPLIPFLRNGHNSLHLVDQEFTISPANAGEGRAGLYGTCLFFWIDSPSPLLKFFVQINENGKGISDKQNIYYLNVSYKAIICFILSWLFAIFVMFCQVPYTEFPIYKIFVLILEKIEEAFRNALDIIHISIPHDILRILSLLNLLRFPCLRRVALKIFIIYLSVLFHFWAYFGDTYSFSPFLLRKYYKWWRAYDISILWYEKIALYCFWILVYLVIVEIYKPIRNCLEKSQTSNHDQA